jgi:RNA recognition motif-containing protein
MDICLGNLPSDVTGNDLREVFESFGRVDTADVVRHHHSDASRGIGFVGMPSRSEAASAIRGLHGTDWNGHAITATEVRSRDPISGACCIRCHCRSGKQAVGNTRHSANAQEAREK